MLKKAWTANETLHFHYANAWPKVNLMFYN